MTMQNETSVSKKVKLEVVQEIFKRTWDRCEKTNDTNSNGNDRKTSVNLTKDPKRVHKLSANMDAIKMSSELLRLFVVEATQRASILAEAEGEIIIDKSHLERILPQLLLDF
mmetsp:Transcript_40054/g.55654  ORF Transcript_40054/g.55654 Transcript_40054/m.55654 type:complete len:112 (-) Transcript_40054:149-484(-)